MNNIVFHQEDNDCGLTLLLKREANIILASLDKNSNEYKNKYGLFKETIQITKAIDKLEINSGEEIDFIIDTLSELWKYGVLSPLTLKDDEFYSSEETHDTYTNTRRSNIFKHKEYIFNSHPFDCIVRAYYDNNKKEQLDIKKEIRDDIRKIFISKGGVITGEYICTFMFRKEIIDAHSFEIKNTLYIPVCEIQDDDTRIYVVDHREPTLKTLKSIYHIPIDIDLCVANKKYNIRKYKKLK